MNLEHEQLAASAVVNLVNEMKSEAEKQGFKVKDTTNGIRILFPGFGGSQEYDFLRLSRMALVGAAAKCPLKIKLDERYGPVMIPEVDLSSYEGVFPDKQKMFSTLNKELREFLSAQGELEPAHIFWTQSAPPGLNATKEEQDYFAVLSNVYEDGRFRNLTLILNHFTYIYLTDNVKYALLKDSERGQYVDLHEDSDKAYGLLCLKVFNRVKRELHTVQS